MGRLQGSKFVVAMVANATMFSHLLPGCSSGRKHLLLPYIFRTLADWNSKTKCLESDRRHMFPVYGKIKIFFFIVDLVVFWIFFECRLLHFNIDDVHLT